MKNNTQEPEVRTFAEIMRTEYPPRARHNTENNTIELDLYEGEPPYEIDLDQCRDHVELVDWIRHIAEKRDCPAIALCEAIELWGKITGLPVYGH